MVFSAFKNKNIIINILLTLLDIPMISVFYLGFVGSVIGVLILTLLNISYFMKSFYYVMGFFVMLACLSFLFYIIYKVHVTIGKEKFIKFIKWHYADYDYNMKMQIIVFLIFLYMGWTLTGILFILCPDSCLLNPNPITLFSYSIPIIIMDMGTLTYASRIIKKIGD